MRSKIVLIRHGITVGNEQRLYYGSTDVPLAERGVKELEKNVAEGIYPDREHAQYFTSGMLRTEQTFEIIYGQKEHGVIGDLRELDFGDFEMKSYSQLENVPEYKEWIEAKDDFTPPPNGESIRDFATRVAKGYEELKVKNELLMLKLRNEEKEAMTVCVCHGGVISGIMNYIWPDEHKNFYEWIPDPGHGYIIEYEDGSAVGKESF